MSTREKRGEAATEFFAAVRALNEAADKCRALDLYVEWIPYDSWTDFYPLPEMNLVDVPRIYPMGDTDDDDEEYFDLEDE